MTEKQFIEQNKEKWQELEHLLVKTDKDADKLQELFIKVSSDLSFARTFYPNRSVRLYLNNLTQKVFDELGKKQKVFGFQAIKDFFRHTLPREISRSRYSFLVSFVIFVIALVIGAVSTANSPEFAAVLLGDEYIEMTETFINEGDPMAVYKQAGQVDMFFGITFNNVKVAFLAFVLGLFGSIGTFFVLMYNGIMVGAFQYWFHTKGLFLTSFLTIWIHGTIEISAIILAGAAGIILGNGVLFPKTHNRTVSLQISAVRALRVIMGTVPLFIIAGILESFVTRLTDMPMLLKIAIISISLLFILLMWVIYPWYYSRLAPDDNSDDQILVQPSDSFKFSKWEFRNLGENFSLTLAQFQRLLGKYMRMLVIPAMTIGSFCAWLKLKGLIHTSEVQVNLSLDYYDSGGVLMLLVNWFIATYMIAVLSFLYQQQSNNNLSFAPYLKKHLSTFVTVSMVWTFPTYFLTDSGWSMLVGMFLIPHFFVIASLKTFDQKDKSMISILKESLTLSFAQYFNYFIAIVMLVVITLLFAVLYSSSIGHIISSLFNWHKIFGFAEANAAFSEYIFSQLIYLTAFPLYFYMVANQYYSIQCKNQAIDLNEKFKTFGKESSIFESYEILD